MSMTPVKPYLVRALYEWITVNHLTPYVVVNTSFPGVRVPPRLIENARLVLDISPMAVSGLLIGEERVEFDARFGRNVEHVVLPVLAILAVYAKENGRGMEFPEDEESVGNSGSTASEPPFTDKTPTSGPKPKLTLVKK